jgi:hypothetical protein
MRIAMLILLLVSSVARADGPSLPVGGQVTFAAKPAKSGEPTADDPLFPGAGHLSVGVATGVPYLGIAEVAFGVTDRIALGLVGGATPYVVGAGLRFRASLFEGGPARLIFRMSGLYYGGSEIEADPWILLMPALLVETRLGSGLRLWGGLGAAGTACVDDLGELFGGGMMGGPWGTVTAGASLPIGQRAVVFLEASLVTKGVTLPERWVGGPPAVVMLGMTRSF